MGNAVGSSAGDVLVVMLDDANQGLLSSVAADVFDFEINPLYLLEFLADPRHLMFVAVANETVVGMASAASACSFCSLIAAQLQLAIDAQFTKVLADSEVTGRKHTISIEANGIYYWRVRSESSDWSNTWTIEVQNGTGSVGTEASEAGLQVARLYSNFPNPFSAVTTISFETSTSSPALVEIFDLIGRRVSTLGPDSWCRHARGAIRRIETSSRSLFIPTESR